MSTLSPELALVDPQLRAHAVSVLPPIRPFAFLELPPFPIDEPQTAAPSVRVSAVLAYLLVAIARTFVFDAFVFASVAVCVLLANLFA